MKQIGVERIWVGGRVGRSKHGVFWENGVTQAIDRGEFPWAANGRRGSQPDGDGQNRNKHSINCINCVFYKASFLLICYNVFKFVIYVQR